MKMSVSLVDISIFLGQIRLFRLFGLENFKILYIKIFFFKFELKVEQKIFKVSMPSFLSEKGRHFNLT